MTINPQRTLYANGLLIVDMLELLFDASTPYEKAKEAVKALEDSVENITMDLSRRTGLRYIGDNSNACYDALPVQADPSWVIKRKGSEWPRIAEIPQLGYILGFDESLPRELRSLAVLIQADSLEAAMAMQEETAQRIMEEATSNPSLSSIVGIKYPLSPIAVPMERL